MILARALFGLLVALAVPPEDDPVASVWPEIPEECRESADALVGAAEELLGRGGAHPEGARLERARQMYRRARLLRPSPDLSLRAADLAAAAGDEEESGDLLSEAAEMSPARISASDRWVLLRRAEARREWREAMLHATVLRDLHAGDAKASPWLAGTLRRLEVAIEAQAIASPPLVRPSEAARRALADGRRALGAGNLAGARERLSLALRLAPGYVEAELALAALETREGRTPDAIRAFRAVLAADPIRFEALVGLAQVLWDEPDRAAKREGLALLDRAVAARPEALALARLAATRWAEWGDAAAALERLEAFRERATAQDRRETDALRDSLLRRARPGLPRDAQTEAGSEMPELSSPALEEWKIAQVYFRRGDPASLEAALERLDEAERLDPDFARAPELAGTIHERRGETALADAAYRRSILAEPARAAPYERLALLLGRQPGRAADAEETWRRAEAAGSAESIFYLAAAADRAGQAGTALNLYRRYLQESAGGVHADEAAQAAARLESARRRSVLWGGIAAALLLAGALAALYRRRSGVTLEQWLRLSASKAREVRPIAGRLRHEVLKHGGLLLSDAARRLRDGDPDARHQVGKLLVSRLYGPEAPGGRLGLLAEAEDGLVRLRELARRDGHTLNVGRDRFLSPIAGAAALLRGVERSLREIARTPESIDPGDVTKAVDALERAGALFQKANAAELMRLIDRAASISVSLPDLRELFDRLSEESRIEAPALEALGLLSDPAESVRVRIDRADWETIWRNLFANAVAGRNGPSGDPLRIAVGAERLRDAATGAPIARFVFADNLAAALSGDTLRGSAADRGWGVVAELLRRHEGHATVGPAPSAAYSKGIVLELPAPEPEAAG